MEISPDIALLQEVGALPGVVEEMYAHMVERPLKKNGQHQRFSTAVLVRGALKAEPLSGAMES